MKLLVAGHGKMVSLIMSHCESKNIFCANFDSADCVDSKNEFVALHFGGGRQLGQLIDFCSQNNGIPIIQASSGLEIPCSSKVPFVSAPNLALPIVKALSALKDFFAAFGTEDCEIGIVESHQASKKTVSATAQVIADLTGSKNVTSVRAGSLQLLLGIPPEHLLGHGYHWVLVQSQGVVIKFSLAVNGLRAVYFGRDFVGVETSFVQGKIA